MKRIYTGYRFIRAKLIQDATMTGWIGTRVFLTNSLMPPAGTAYPFVTVFAVTAPTLKVVGNLEVWTDVLWQIEVWTKGSEYDVIAQRTERIDQLLDGASGVMTGASYGSGIIVALVKEREIAPPNPPSGDITYLRGGAEYRQYIQAA